VTANDASGAREPRALKTCEYDGAPFLEPRSHPWTDATASAAYRYRDLKAAPGEIRTSLEDFVPWSHYPAIGEFYTLLEWLNAKASTLESNDCAFTGPHANESPSFPKSLQCSGRVMVLYRALAENLSRDRIDVLKNGLHHRLAALDPAFRWGMVGTTVTPVRYVTLPTTGDGQLGHQLMISFWAWGGSEVELMKNLGRVVKNLSRGLRDHAIPS
jgi:hypothetical protein